MHAAVVTFANPTLPDEAIFINTKQNKTKQAAETSVVHFETFFFFFKYILIGCCSFCDTSNSVILHNKSAILCIVLLLRLHKNVMGISSIELKRR